MQFPILLALHAILTPGCFRFRFTCSTADVVAWLTQDERGVLVSLQVTEIWFVAAAAIPVLPAARSILTPGSVCSECL